MRLLLFLAILAAPLFHARAASQKTPLNAGDYLSSYIAGMRSDFSSAAIRLNPVQKQQPDNLDILENLFRYNIAAGDMKRAVYNARRIKSLEPFHGFANLVLGIESIRRKRYHAAQQYFTDASSQDHPWPALPVLRAWAYQGAGKTQKARNSLAAFRRDNKIDFISLFQTALLLQAQNRNPQPLYQSALTKKAASGRLILSYGRYMQKQKKPNPKSLQNLYDVYIESRSPQSPEIRLLRQNLQNPQKQNAPVTPASAAAECLYAFADLAQLSGGDNDAILYFRLALLLQPRLDDALIGLAHVFRRKERLNDAIQLQKQIPHNSPYHLNAAILIAADYASLEQNHRAKRILQKILQSQPQNPRLLFALGELYAREKNYENAAKEYSQALLSTQKNAPQKWQILYARGIAFERTDRWNEAETDLLAAAELSGNQPVILNYLAYSWVEKKLNLQRALQMLQRAVKGEPRNGSIIDSLGWAHYRLGNYKDALFYLEEAVRLEPDQAVINDHLGDALWKTGRRIEARFQWRHALELDPQEDGLADTIRLKLEHGLAHEQKIENEPQL